jgi:hypothetical protein
MEFIMNKVLYRRLFFVSILGLFLAVSPSISETVLWTGDGDAIEWSDMFNWSDWNDGSPVWPFRLPNETDRVVINTVGEIVHISEGYAALADTLEVSSGASPIILRLDEGSVTATTHISVSTNPDHLGHGIFYVESAGTVDTPTIYIGCDAEGDMFVNGGTVNISDVTLIGGNDPVDSVGRLVIDGGTFNTNKLNVCFMQDAIEKTSTITIKRGGVLNASTADDQDYPVTLGPKGRAELYIETGGEFNCPPRPDGTGGVVLLGWNEDPEGLSPDKFGYIKIIDGTMYAGDIWTMNGQVDIVWGRLILAGDKVETRVADMVAAGTLVADGGVGTIEAVYDVDLDQTVVTATDVTPQGDISGDGSVDLTDFAMLAAEWLTGVE